jgi:hypothetical protein
VRPEFSVSVISILDKTLQYINLLGLSLHIYPGNTLTIYSPYGALDDIKAIGQLARQHRKKQNATMQTVKQISGLGLRFLSPAAGGREALLPFLARHCQFSQYCALLQVIERTLIHLSFM